MLVIDNFIKDKDFLAELRADEHWQHNMSSLWFSKESDDSSMWLKLVKEIWTRASDLIELGDYEGYEVWSQVISSRTLEWHKDKDEYLWRTQNKLVTPSFGSIYYVHSQPIEGGFLEIQTGRGLERIEPVPNRLVIHNPALVHRVCFSGNGRRSLLSNLWPTKPLDENFKGINYGDY